MWERLSKEKKMDSGGDLCMHDYTKLASASHFSTKKRLLLSNKNADIS